MFKVKSFAPKFISRYNVVAQQKMTQETKFVLTKKTISQTPKEEVDYNLASNETILEDLFSKKLPQHKLEEVLKDKTRAVFIRRQFFAQRILQNKN